MLRLLIFTVMVLCHSLAFARDDNSQKPKPRTREQVNGEIDREKNGVYFLSEATFDDFINYNDLVLICFYETGDLEPMLSEMLAAVSRRVQDQHQLFEVAMVQIDRAPMLEARYHPVTAPDFRIFYKARNLKFYGQLDLDQLADWTMRKIGLPNNRIRSLSELKKKLKKSALLVIFIADKNEANRYFNDYLEVSRKLLTLDDVEFAFVYPSDFGNDMAHFERVTKAPFYQQFNFGVRVYRRGSLADIKDLNRWSLRSEEDVTQLDIENFIFKSTFVGQGPDYIREANSDNMMKFFSQNQPGLLLFYSSELLKGGDKATVDALESLEKVFDDISGRIIVAKIDVMTSLGKKLMQVTNVDAQEALQRPLLRIMDPNQANNAILKYKPAVEEGVRIEKRMIKDFVNDYIGGRLKKFLKTQKEPTTPSTMKLPITALNTDSFRSLLEEEPEKDIFIFFAGPACFACPSVWPEFQKLVRVLHAESTDIVFAFVDLSHNELQEEAKIYAFPTLRLYPASTDRQKTWINFQQSPSFDTFSSFLQEKATAAKLVADEAKLRQANEEEMQLNDVLAGQQQAVEKKPLPPTGERSASEQTTAETDKEAAEAKASREVQSRQAGAELRQAESTIHDEL